MTTLTIRIIALSIFALFAFASASNVALPANSVISFEPVNLGKMQQGEKKTIVLNGVNNSKEKIEVENVIDQAVGGENFKFPKSIAPNEKFKVEFTLNSSHIEGKFAHNIILITTNGKPYIGIVQGEVENPIIFNERILDLGYYSQGDKKEWIFYAWSSDGKQLKLKLKEESLKEFDASFSEVKLDVKNFDNIKEGGNTPGIKIKLSVKKLDLPKNKQKSINKIVSFFCEDFPNSTPELLVTGYWK